MHLSFDIGYTFIDVVHQKVHFSLNEISECGTPSPLDAKWIIF